jgi:hypothetical protein
MSWPSLSRSVTRARGSHAAYEIGRHHICSKLASPTGLSFTQKV